MDAAHLIRRARQRAGLSQAQLADRLRTSQPLIARWERSAAVPSFDRLIEAIRACDLDLDYRLVPRDTSNAAVIDAQLRLTPAERIRSAVATSRMIERARRGTRGDG